MHLHTPFSPQICATSVPISTIEALNGLFKRSAALLRNNAYDTIVEANFSVSMYSTAIISTRERKYRCVSSRLWNDHDDKTFHSRCAFEKSTSSPRRQLANHATFETFIHYFSYIKISLGVYCITSLSFVIVFAITRFQQRKRFGNQLVVQIT